MRSTVARLTAILAPIVAFSASTASAQTQVGAPAFANLAFGRDVKVTNIDGSSQKGQVTQVSPTDMVVGGVRISYAQIAKVEKSSNRILKGAVIGGAIGGGFVATVYGLCVAADDEYCGTSSEMVEQVVLNAAIGAGIGAGIGALQSH